MEVRQEGGLSLPNEDTKGKFHLNSQTLIMPCMIRTTTGMSHNILSTPFWIYIFIVCGQNKLLLFSVLHRLTEFISIEVGRVKTYIYI